MTLKISQILLDSCILSKNDKLTEDQTLISIYILTNESLQRLKETKKNLQSELRMLREVGTRREWKLMTRIEHLQIAMDRYKWRLAIALALFSRFSSWAVPRR